MSERYRPTPTQKSALAPDVRRFDERAARAWTERMAVRPLPDGRYAVDSESGATYVVDLAARTCTCPDNRIRGERCKHLRRVGIEITTRRVPPPGKRRASCAACGVETFVPVDDDAPHLCSACHLEPGAVVRDREAARSATSDGASGDTASSETGDRLAVVRVTDRRADEVTVEAAGCTVAEYDTNAAYPDDDLVVEAVYLGDLGADEPRQYSFPRSRLDRVDDAAVVGLPHAPA